MKWFKHDADASNDAKLRKLRIKYGAQGYGIYWYCLELIARNVEKHNLTFELEHDSELIADDFKLSPELVQHIMKYMVDVGLFEDTNGIITCLKMASRTDEYTQKLLLKNKTSPDYVPTLSLQNPEMSVLIEENRLEENIKDKKKHTVKKSNDITLKEYIDDCKQKNIPVLDSNDAVFINASKLGIDDEWLKVCWLHFKSKYIASPKKYADWKLTFNNCVKENYYKIWEFGQDNLPYLTSKGRGLIKSYEVSNNG